MQIKEKANSNVDLKIYDEKIDPGAADFISGLSREKLDKVGKQITVGQLIEKQIIIMTISKAMIMYIGITYKINRPTPDYIY